jgi:hypothetical protein
MNAKGDADALSGSLSPVDRVEVRVVAQPVVPGWAGSGLVGDETPLTPGPSPRGRGETERRLRPRVRVCSTVLGLDPADDALS